MVPIEREEEGVLVLLSFVWFPSDNTLFIAPGPVICTNMTPSYRTINSITQLYVHAWIVGGTDGHGHGHDNKFTK